MKKKPDQGYAAKHDAGAPLDAALAQALENESGAEGVSCDSAHAVANQLQQAPHEAGRTLDLLNRPIVHCQLGLFGYTPRKKIVTPATEIDSDLADEIRAALVNGRLPCKTAWDIADRRQIERLAVAETCEGLKIKISDCQLGAF